MKKKIIKAILIALGIIGATIGLYFILRAFGLLNIDSIREMIKGCGNWAVIVYIALFVLVNSVFSFVPATNMSFIGIGVVLFGANWKTFVICAIAVFLTSYLLYAIGRFGGNKLVAKLMGKSETEKAIQVMNDYGTSYFPLCMIFAGFPDDALCCIAGTIKMKLWFYSLSVLIGRGIGVATIVFGVKLLPTDLTNAITNFDKDFILNHLWEYLEMITILAIWVVALFVGTTKLNKIYLKKKKEKRNELTNNKTDI